jgi:hypothetical protein
LQVISLLRDQQTLLTGIQRDVCDCKEKERAGLKQIADLTREVAGLRRLRQDSITGQQGGPVPTPSSSEERGTSTDANRGQSATRRSPVSFFARPPSSSVTAAMEAALRAAAQAAACSERAPDGPQPDSAAGEGATSTPQATDSEASKQGQGETSGGIAAGSLKPGAAPTESRGTSLRSTDNSADAANDHTPGGAADSSAPMVGPKDSQAPEGGAADSRVSEGGAADSRVPEERAASCRASGGDIANNRAPGAGYADSKEPDGRPAQSRAPEVG